MENYDVAVIGTGPGGISAAITAKQRNKNVLLLGSKDLSAKLSKAHLIRNYPGLPETSGADLAAALQKHLDVMGISITEDPVTAVYAMGDYFGLQGSSGTMYQADAVILATGVTASKPLPGEIEYLGSGISYCATCDAPLYRGKEVAVLGFSPKEEAEARYLSEVTEKVYYFPVYKDEVSLPDNVTVIREKPVRIDSPEIRSKTVVTDGGEYTVSGVFILRDSVAPAQLVPGLEVDGSHIAVDRSMATNIPGCFACGDVVGLPYQYIKSAGEGNIAALSAAAYIDKKKNEKK